MKQERIANSKRLFRRVSEMLNNGIIGFLLLIFAASVVLPLLWAFITSLKSTNEIFGSPWTLPHPIHWENYVQSFKEHNIGRCFLNSFIVTISTLAILLPTGAMAAYILGRYRFRLSKFIYSSFIGGMMFPLFLVIVPLFLLMKQLDLLNNLLGLVLVYVAYSLPFTIFVLTGFFESLPNELAEAATLDGCGHFRTFSRVMLPLAKPGIIVVGIFNAIGLWNEYPIALVLLAQKESSNSMATLPLAVAKITMAQQYTCDWGALFASLVIVMVPILVVYWIFRDKIHETMLAGALKG
jgi:N-acetylglucosamine transport system permease protein